MPSDMIRYDLLTQEAMRGIVRHVLTGVARDGYIPGDHHFLIGFLTGYRGVRLSRRLREQYPEEMSIVLQHQFEDLAVTDHGFEVSLSFSGISERLSIPFDAITQFFDPSVNFGLKFELVDKQPALMPKKADGPTPPSPKAKLDERGKRHPSPKGAGSEPHTLPPLSSDSATVSGGPPPADGKPRDSKSADVVSLDKFRKK